MSTKSRYEIQLDQLLEACFDELRQMPDSEVLAGEPAGEVRARAEARLARATQEAGRRRLIAARAEAALERSRTPIAVSIQEARDYIARIIRNTNYTLAARQLEEMSEDEVLRLYDQLRELEEQNSSPQI
ncbi:MAG TPA: hypothetical protein VFU13_14880 [Steroidobacteraceae bacterium]|nr:hypothetical protein [Steroidobacteraceae bacterium]